MATYKNSQEVEPAITARKSSEWTDFNSIQLDFKSCALNTQPQPRPRIMIIALNIFGPSPLRVFATRVRVSCLASCLSPNLQSNHALIGHLQDEMVSFYHRDQNAVSGNCCQANFSNCLFIPREK